MAVAGAIVVEFYANSLTHGLQAADSTAPSITVGPTAVVSPTSVGVTATITDDTPPIVFYAVVVADGAGAPSSAQIQAGTDSLDAAAPNDNDTVTSGGVASLFIGGLSSGTAYDVYYVALDDSGNDSTPAKLDITTTTPPAASGTSPIASIVHSRRRRRE